MSLRGDHRGGGRVLFIGGLIATFLVHAGILFSVWLGRAHAGTTVAQPAFGTIVDVQAVKFGKPRDMSFLPHKEAPPPPRDKPKLTLTQNEKALPKLKDPNEPKDTTPIDDDPLKRTHAKDFQNMADPENTGSAVEEGDPNGLKGGTSTVGKGPVYLQHLQAAIQNAWVVPTTISDKDLLKLKAQACIKMDATGKLTEYKLSQTSGNERFDATLLDALASMKQFDPPTDEEVAKGVTVKSVVTSDGICMNFKKERSE